jgi:diacylglycerol O-acyltransferase
MERLSALDASFLRVEGSNAHMHVGWLSMLDLPQGCERLDPAAVRRQVEVRLHHAPRFRQVVYAPPPGLGPPAWVDAEDFRLEHHVTAETAARTPTTALRRIVDAFLSEPLPRERPLWRIHVVPRLPGRRAAIVGKVHHAMVDGIAAVQLGMLLFDVDPAAAPQTPVPWQPRAVPPARRIVDAARDSALEQFRIASRAAALGLDPGRGARIAGTLRRAAFSVAEDVRRPAPDSYLNDPIGPQRRLVGTALPLRPLLEVKERSGAKLNDVVLALVAGALARLAEAHGKPPQDLRVMVPASVRNGGRAGDGNAISFLFVDLPVATASPRRRLELIRERTQELKRSGRIAGTDQLLRVLELLPGAVQGQAARLAASPRMYNLTISNVPGPPMPLYVGGGRVRSILPVIPIAERHALSVGALSYDGKLHLSGYLDPERLPRASRIPLMLADAYEELVA